MCCFKNKFRHHYTTDASCAFHLVGFCNCTNLNIQNLNFWQSFHQMQKYFWINDNVPCNFVLISRISKSCLDPISDHKCSRQNRNNRQHHHGQAHQVVKIYLTHSAVQTGWHFQFQHIYSLSFCENYTYHTVSFLLRQNNTSKTEPQTSFCYRQFSTRIILQLLSE